MKILDLYFERPVLYDYMASAILSLSFISAFMHFNFKRASIIVLRDISTEIGTISLSSAGFILTILTVLVTFKNTFTFVSVRNMKRTFDTFFISGLYSQTLDHFKNCIKSLLLIAILGFTIKLFFTDMELELTYFYCVFGMTVLVLTLWRSVLILSKILQLQSARD